MDDDSRKRSSSLQHEPSDLGSGDQRWSPHARSVPLRRLSNLMIRGNFAPFETLLDEHVGGYGRWQHQISLLNVLLTINAAAQTVSYPMITGKFDYHCVDGKTNSTGHSSVFGDDNRCFFKNEATNEEQQCTAWNFTSRYYGPAIVSEFALVCHRIWLGALVHTSFTIGCGFGVLSFGWLSDKLGRRYVLRLSIPLMIFMNFALVATPDIWMTLIIRFFQGILCFGNFTVIYVLSMETTLPQWRAFVGNIVHIPWGLNFMFTAGAAAWLPTWRWTQLVISLPSLLCLLVYWPRFVPESPRWLLLHAREEQAYETLLHAKKLNRKKPPNRTEAESDDEELKQAILSRTRPAGDVYTGHETSEMTVQLTAHTNKTDAVTPFVSLQNGVNNASEPNAVRRDSRRNAVENATGVLALFRTRRMRYHTLLILVIWFQGAMSNHGINFYVPGMAPNPFVSYALVGVGETLAPAVGAFVFRTGRRVPIAITYVLGALVCLAILPFVRWTISEFTAVALGVVATFLSDMAFNGIYVHTSELMPTILRNTGLGLASTAARVGSAGVSFVVAYKEQVWWLPPVVFAVGMFVGTICTLLLPSTDDSIMPETVQDVEDGFEKVKVVRKAEQRAGEPLQLEQC